MITSSSLYVFVYFLSALSYHCSEAKVMKFYCFVLESWKYLIVSKYVSMIFGLQESSIFFSDRHSLMNLIHFIIIHFGCFGNSIANFIDELAYYLPSHSNASLQIGWTLPLFLPILDSCIYLHRIHYASFSQIIVRIETLSFVFLVGPENTSNCLCLQLWWARFERDEMCLLGLSCFMLYSLILLIIKKIAQCWGQQF